MFLWPQKDGTVVTTGSFNQEEYDAYMAEHGAKKKAPAPAKTEAAPAKAEAVPSVKVEPAKSAPAKKTGGARW